MRNVDTIKRRAGKSLTITLSVLTDSERKSLVGRDIELSVHTPLGQHRKLDFEIIEDFKIRFNFRDMHYGLYEFSVFENWDKEVGATAVDSDKAIELVPKSYMEGGTAPEGLDVESVDLGVLNMTVSGGSGGGTAAPLTKEAVEEVLTGDITTHNHATEINKALQGYVKAEQSKGLSSNDFTNEYKQKVDNLDKFSGKIEDANSAAASATAAAKKANEAVKNLTVQTTVIKTTKEVTI